MKILLLEDDVRIAEALASDLTEQHYVVDIASDGQAGLELVEVFSYDLLIANAMLPKLSGISLCERLRSCGYSLPVMMLSSKDVSQQKVMVLDAGADDYVVQPFDPQELAARIRALLRRGNSTSPPILEWGALSLNPASCEVTYSGQPFYPTPKEYGILQLLLRHSRRVFSRRAIVEQLWALESPPEEETVKAHIKGLRQKLKSVGAPGDFIETVYGLGYRLKLNS